MMRSPKTIVFATIAVVFASITAFFTFFGMQLIYAALTFEGEGSLGHVGMYIAAVLYPLLALLFAGFTVLAWRTAFRNPPQARPPA
jgi:glucan phosphoethanolaminetransferase (alkaline phosphatase superfamily)